MRIFLDANILFSAAKTDGAMRQLLHDLRLAGHELWADAYVLEEARRNLAAHYPASMTDFNALLPSWHHAPAATAAGQLPPPGDVLPAKDQPVLAGAIRLRCHALVTGDRAHFGTLYGQTIGGVVIHSPATLARALLD